MEKNILILGYNFFGYENEILKELSKKYNVKYVNLENNFLERTYSYILKKTIGNEKRNLFIIKLWNKKINKIIKNEFNIDILFVLGIFNLKKENFIFLDKTYNIKNKKLYLWDTIQRIENFYEYRKYFNEIYSFDKKDCDTFQLIYRPTFFSKRLERLENIKNIYKFSFVGAHSLKRENFLKKILDQNSKNNFVYLYLDFFMYIKKYIFDIKYKLNNFKFFKISKEKYNLIMSQSEIIIDLLQFNQTGVTQRSLDALYLKKKIITDNKYIKNYDFYNPNNILIINENTTRKEIEEFQNKEYIEIDKNIISYYSIERWVQDIFESEE